MPAKRRFLSGLLFAWLLQSAAAAFCQTVVEDNRAAAGHYSRHEWSESVEAFRNLIAQHPDSLEATVGYFYLGESLMQLDDFRNAYLAFQQYLVRHPQSDLSMRATFRMAEAAYHQGNDATGIRLMETFIEQNPDDPLLEFALSYLGEMRLRRIEPQLAAKVFEKSLLLFPEGKLADRTTIGLARAHHLSGDLQKAINVYQIAADNENHPLAADADIQIAHLFIGEKDYESARQHLLRALNHSGNPERSVEANYWLARISILEGDQEGAYEMLQSFVGQPAPKDIAAAIYFDAASVAHQIGNSEQAFDWLVELSESYPNSNIEDAALHLQIEIACVHEDEALRKMTEGLVTRFLNQHANSRFRPGVLEKLGRYHYACEEYAKAIASFEQLIRENKFVDGARASSDRHNWLYLRALSHIGLRDFVAAEATLGQIHITTCSEEIRLLSQLALATARFGQKKYQAAIPSYQAFLDSQEKLLNSAQDQLLKVDRGQLLRARQELTLCFAETGMWAEANQSFKTLQKTHSDAPIVNQTAEYLANLALEAGQSKAAADILERMVVVDTDSKKLPYYLSSLGWLKYESEEREQACELFQRLIEEFPDHELAGPAAMCLAKSFDEEKKYDRAAQQYGWVVQHFGKTEYGKIATLRQAHALINSGDKSSYSQVKLLLKNYLAFPGELAPKDEALFQLGWVTAELGQTQESQDAFQRLLDECPTSKYRPDSALRMAQASIAANQLDQAILQLETISDTTLLSPAIRIRKHFLLGEIASRQGRWTDVSKLMSELVAEAEQPSTKVKATYWLGESAFRQRKYEDAVQHFRLVQSEHKELSPELQPWIWLRLAQSLGQLEQWKDAKKSAEDGLKLFPTFNSKFEFEFVVARGLEDLGRFSDARAKYENVIKSPVGGSSETAAISQWRMGEMYFHQENYPEAIKAYYLVDSNFAYETWRAAALLQAGKCQEHLANWEHAKKLYKRLAEQFPDSPHRKTADERMARIEQEMPNKNNLKRVKTTLKK